MSHSLGFALKQYIYIEIFLYVALNARDNLLKMVRCIRVYFYCSGDLVLIPRLSRTPTKSDRLQRQAWKILFKNLLDLWSPMVGSLIVLLYPADHSHQAHCSYSHNGHGCDSSHHLHPRGSFFTLLTAQQGTFSQTFNHLRANRIVQSTIPLQLECILKILCVGLETAVKEYNNWAVEQWILQKFHLHSYEAYAGPLSIAFTCNAYSSIQRFLKNLLIPVLAYVASMASQSRKGIAHKINSRPYHTPSFSGNRDNAFTTRNCDLLFPGCASTKIEVLHTGL